jgi:hypothetical protein
MPLTSSPENRPAGMNHAAGALKKYHMLLVAQGFGRVYLRRLPGGQVGGKERGGVAEDHYEQQRAPRDGVLEAGDILADIVYERARETEAKSHPYTNAE